MNTIRKQFPREVEALYPVLHDTYRAVGAFQKSRSERNHRRLLDQLDRVAPHLDFFRPYVPGPKQAYFVAFTDPNLDTSDRIIALDTAVGALHVDFPMERAYLHRESIRLREVLEAARAGSEPASHRPAVNGALLTGIPASSGMVDGAAHIAKLKSHYRRMPPGAVLVTTMSRPEYAPLLGDVAAIVTETGGMLCHAAIVARELGIPCVVAAGGATRRIKNGWRLRVDGDTGAIHRLDR